MIIQLQHSGHRRCLALVACLIACLYAPPIATAASREAEMVAEVADAIQELDSLRRYLGRPETSTLPYSVTNVQTREVYFQARTLLHKVNRLCFEQAGVRYKEVDRVPREIEPAHVLTLLQLAVKRIREVKVAIGVPREEEAPLSVESHSFDELFHLIVRANRQINALLERQFTPSDVYEQVTNSIGYAERLLDHCSDLDATIPDAPQFIPNKQPADVFLELIDCFRVASRISELSGVETLRIEKVQSQELDNVTPSDVYDIASLVLAELTYLHGLNKELHAPQTAYYPGRKIPAEVFQRVGIVKLQLAKLEEYASTHPQWLK